MARRASEAASGRREPKAPPPRNVDPRIPDPQPQGAAADPGVMSPARYYVRFEDGSRSHMFANHQDASALAARTGGAVRSTVTVYGYD